MYNFIFPTRKPKAFIFDWDNTLVNTWPVITEALNKTRAAYGLETWTVEEARIKSARALTVSFPEWFGEEWETARDLFYSSFAAVHCEKLVAMPQAEELLESLYSLGLPLMVVSNKKGNYLREEISHLGWNRYFIGVVGVGDTVKSKPDREPVDLVLSGIIDKNEYDRVWFVGDSYPDVECALASGCTPVTIHDVKCAEEYNVKIHFSDCHTMKTALYNWFKIDTTSKSTNL